MTLFHSLAAITMALSCLHSVSFADFGLVERDRHFQIDTGAGLRLDVDRSNGNVSSWKFKGVEYRFDDSKRASHLNAGLGSNTRVTAKQIGDQWVQVTIETLPENKVVSDLTHYLLVRKGENTAYMATFATKPPGVGELRWITRLWAPRIPYGPVPSDLRESTGPVESGDVFGMSDGTTRSKYFGDRSTHGKDRAIDLSYCGAVGPKVGVWMVYGNRESSSGGPFFRDIQNQCGSSQEIYNYLFSGHNQTEDWRPNVLHGPYALVFTDGPPPALPLDWSSITESELDLKGLVANSERGKVSGQVSGVQNGCEAVVGFANQHAQYWTRADDEWEVYQPPMKPGTSHVPDR